MAVKLRLTRFGKKKKPFYRIIAIDSRAPRDGRYLENLGTYNPLPNPFEVTINEERVLYWLGVGAIPSDTVKSLFRREGILFKQDLIKRGLTAEQMDQEMKRWEVIKLERQRTLEKKAEATVDAKSKAKEQKAEVEEASSEPDVAAEAAVEEPVAEEAAAETQAVEEPEAPEQAVEEKVAEAEKEQTQDDPKIDEEPESEPGKADKEEKK